MQDGVVLLWVNVLCSGTESSHGRVNQIRGHFSHSFPWQTTSTTWPCLTNTNLSMHFSVPLFVHIHEVMQFVLLVAAASEQNVFAVGVPLAVIGVCVGIPGFLFATIQILRSKRYVHYNDGLANVSVLHF